MFSVSVSKSAYPSLFMFRSGRKADMPYGEKILFLRATSQAGMLACPFGDCRKGLIPRCLHRGQWHQPVRTLKRTGSFLSKKRKIHPWLIFLFFEFEVLYYSHHPCIVTYPLVLKHFCIGGLRLPSIRNFAVGMELIHLPHRL